MNDNPIGVFDSGLGGLSVWRAIRAELPGESLIYFGDGLNCPYGSKSPEEIRHLTQGAIEWLIEQGVKLIVVACNTATAAGIGKMRELYPDIPFVGMEPAVKPASLSTESGVVAVLATEASFEGDLYKNTALKYGRDITILPVAGKGFVELVENDMEDTPQAFETVSRIVEPLLAEGADRIVLGCTHYPFLRHVVERVAEGSGAEIIDPAPAVARQVARLLDQHGMRAGKGHKPMYEFHTAGGDDYLRRLIAKSRRAMEMDL